jgi:hypothetical protein
MCFEQIAAFGKAFFEISELAILKKLVGQCDQKVNWIIFSLRMFFVQKPFLFRSFLDKVSPKGEISYHLVTLSGSWVDFPLLKTYFYAILC